MTTGNPNLRGGGFERATSATADTVETLKSDISNLAASVKRMTTDQMGDRLADAQDFAKDKIGGLETSIRRNPSQSAMIAAGLGFVVGLILSR